MYIVQHIFLLDVLPQFEALRFIQMTLDNKESTQNYRHKKKHANHYHVEHKFQEIL